MSLCMSLQLGERGWVVGKGVASLLGLWIGVCGDGCAATVHTHTNTHNHPTTPTIPTTTTAIANATNTTATDTASVRVLRRSRGVCLVSWPSVPHLGIRALCRCMHAVDGAAW